MILLLAACTGDPSADTGTPTTASDTSPSGETDAAPPVGTIEGEWVGSVATYVLSSSYYTGSGGVVDNFGSYCDGTAELTVDLAADPSATGTLSCGGYLGDFALTGLVDGDTIDGTATGAGCEVDFALVLASSGSSLSGTLGVCYDSNGQTVPATLTRR
jgi:hypothetical protein